MADIHHVISQGIGTPADIPHFILVGLSPQEEVGLFLTWTIKAGATPVPDAKVWLSSADIYTAANIITDSIQHTDINGQVIYELDPDVVYFGWRHHSAYTWTDPWRFRYNSSLSRWEYWDGAAYVEWTP